MIGSFWDRVDADGDCWVWTGGRTSKGYGATWAMGRQQQMLAHRYAWITLVGEIPAGLHIDHLCRNKVCVNPDHLEPVTPRVNVLRGYSMVAANARATHCTHGHEFTPENTRLKHGDRICRQCRRDSNRRYKARRAA